MTDLRSDEFSPEQRITIEIMRVAGTKNPESVARADRLSAYRVGAHMEPVLRRMCEGLTKAALAVQHLINSWPTTCPLCLMVEWRRITLRCDFCGVTAEELHRASIWRPA